MRTFLSLVLIALGVGCSDRVMPGANPGTKEGPNTTRPEEPDAAVIEVASIVLPPTTDLMPLETYIAGCQSSPTSDFDQDGYTGAEGDCNDCDPLTNPGAYDVADNKIDEDCNGVADDEAMACDQGPASAADDALVAARSLGLCRVAQANAQGSQKTWGVLAARWVFPDGTTASLQQENTFSDCTRGGGGQGQPPHPRSRSVLTAFGPNVSPRDGKTLVALSSGIAQAGSIELSPEGAEMCTRSETPTGFPVSSKAACPRQQIHASTEANDGVALELEIRAPSNAFGFSFDFDFYTYEYPEYICTEFNDFFVALLYSKHASTPANKNISFDKQGNPVCVNNGFVEVCSPDSSRGKQFTCPLGRKELIGTGFDVPFPKNSAATGWLRTNAKIEPGESFKLRFAIWDMGDEILDSTVLLDRFMWVVEPGKAVTGTDRIIIL
jgi:hypothetical protein